MIGVIQVSVAAWMMVVSSSLMLEFDRYSTDMMPRDSESLALASLASASALEFLSRGTCCMEYRSNWARVSLTLLR